MIPRQSRRSHARKATPVVIELTPIEPQDIRAVCLVGGCDWSVPITLGRDAAKEVEKHRREKHSWVRAGRLHRIEIA